LNDLGITSTLEVTNFASTLYSGNSSNTTTNNSESREEKREYGSNVKPPKLPKNVKVGVNATAPPKNGTASKPEKEGPQQHTFNPNQKTTGRFKGGAKNGVNDTVCGKTRYQQISITALGNVTTAVRILQTTSTAPVYTMTL